MGVPMAFRGVKPGAAHLALAVVDAFNDARLVDAHMPGSLSKMKLWLNCVRLAQSVGPDFVQWTSRHAIEIGGSPAEVAGILRDIADWVFACYRASVPPHIRRAIRGEGPSVPTEGEQFVCRKFNADMSLTTVTKLSADWHEAVAANMSGPNYEFPEPWCPAGRSSGFDVIPITTSAELYREGKLLHHCVGSYQGVVWSGERYFYSVRQGNVRVATLELCESGGSVAIGQIRGACNVQPSKEIIVAVKSWFRSQSEFRPREKPKRVELFDDNIPF